MSPLKAGVVLHAVGLLAHESTSLRATVLGAGSAVASSISFHQLATHSVTSE